MNNTRKKPYTVVTVVPDVFYKAAKSIGIKKVSARQDEKGETVVDVLFKTGNSGTFPTNTSPEKMHKRMQLAAAPR